MSRSGDSLRGATSAPRHRRVCGALSPRTNHQGLGNELIAPQVTQPGAPLLPRTARRPTALLPSRGVTVGGVFGHYAGNNTRRRRRSERRAPLSRLSVPVELAPRADVEARGYGIVGQFARARARG